MVKVFEKKRSKHLSYRLRFMSKPSKDAIQSKKLQKLMIILSLKQRSLPIDPLKRGKHEKIF